MGKIHHGATLTPHFRDFLPAWLARQPWHLGTATPAPRPVGYFRFEDPAGEVGMETHLVEDGGVVYQVPMTYRGAPLDATAHGPALIPTTEHSVLGTRWIYDGGADPLWITRLLRVIDADAVSEPSLKRGVGPAEARGRRRSLVPLTVDRVRTELVRVLTPPAAPPDDPAVAGLLIGSWSPGPDVGATVTGCLAIVRDEPHPG